MPTILIKKSDTPGAAPATANLTNAAGGAEIAVNTADKRLFSITSASAIIELGTNPQSITVTSGAVLNGGVVINELGADVDLRVESDTNVNAFFVDGANGNVGIGTDSPGALLDVRGSAIFNEGGADVDFRVEGDTDANLLFVDASTDRVGVGTDTPAAKFDLNGASILRGNVLTTGAFIPGANVSAPTADAFIIRSADNTMQLGTASTARLTIDPSGNLGLGVTPSAWFSNGKALQLGSGAFVLGTTTATQVLVGANFYFDGTNNKYIANGEASYQQQTAGKHEWYTAPSGTAGNAISFTQAMTLTAAGDLGVGTTSPSQKLSVAGNISTTNALLESTGTNVNFGTITAGYLAFLAGSGAERARITAGGALCVGDTATTNNAKLKLKATTGTSNIAYFDCAQTDPYGLQIRYTAAAPNGTDNEFVACYDEVGSLVVRASIRSNGGLANYSANNVNLASDERLKKDISPLDSTWGKVKEMEVVKFRYKDCNEGDPLLYGVIAQQVQPIVPDLVVVTQEAKEAVAAKDAVLDEEGNVIEPAVEAKEATPEYYGIREQPMYWLAIKALQEAMTRIEELEAKVAALEAK